MVMAMSYRGYFDCSEAFERRRNFQAGDVLEAGDA